MADQQPRSRIQHHGPMALWLSITVAGIGMGEYRPPTNPPAKRTDRFGDSLPEGTIARLGTVRLRAVGAQTALSPDGKTIVTVSGGRQVCFWDAGSGKFNRRRELPIKLTHNAYLSADGRLLAVREEGVDPPIEIWDVGAGERLQQLALPQGSGIYRATISSDGKSFAVASRAGIKPVVFLWDVASGRKRELTGLSQVPDFLAFSPDSKLLATADSRFLICWDVAKGEVLWEKPSAFGVRLAFTPDGTTLIASAGNRERDWHAWAAASGKPADGWKLPAGYNYADFIVAPDGRTLVFAQPRSVRGADGRVRLWDLRKGELLHTLKSEGPSLGPFFPDGKSFLTNDGCLQRWELATGKPLLLDPSKQGHRAEVSRLVYSPDGRRLASAAGDGKIYLWNAATTKPLHILSGRDRYSADLVFTPDGHFLVSGFWGFAGELNVWDTETGKEVRRIPVFDPKRGERQQNVSRVHLTPDGRTAIVLGYDPSRGGGLMKFILSRWDLETGQPRSRADIGPTDSMYSGFSPDGRSLACYGNLLDTVTGKLQVKLENGPRGITYYTFSPDGKLVAGYRLHAVLQANRISIHMDGIEIWDAATGRSRQFIPTDWVGQLAFAPDGRYLAAADLQGIRLWELATDQVVLKHQAQDPMRGSYGHSFASSLCMAPDGRSLATGHPDSTILVWTLVPSDRPAAAKELPQLWQDLSATDGERAYVAAWRLTNAPGETIGYMKERLRPFVAASAEQVRPLLADLDSDDFSRREVAASKLRELGDRATGLLKDALQARPSLEMRQRIEKLLKDAERLTSQETLRTFRAIVVLERIGTAEAQQALQTLAQGMPEARITREAKASLERRTARRPTVKR